MNPKSAENAARTEQTVAALRDMMTSSCTLAMIAPGADARASAWRCFYKIGIMLDQIGRL